MDALGCYYTRYTPDTWGMDRHRLMPAAFRAEVRRLLPLLLKAAAKSSECPLSRLDGAAMMEIISALGDMECARLAVVSDAAALEALAPQQLLAAWRAKGGQVSQVVL